MSTIIDLTEMMEEKEKMSHPCDCCISGFGSISQYIDPKTGHFMQVNENCTETCEILKRWHLEINMAEGG